MYTKFTLTRHGVWGKEVLMRINATLTIIILVIMQLGAKTSAQPYLTLSKQNITISEVFKEIKKQTDHSVFYSAKRVDDKRTIDAQFKNTDIRDVLAECLKGQPLTFVIREKTVVIKESPTPSSSNPAVISTERSDEKSLILAFPEVRGKITDSIGQPLQGASIRVLNAEGQRTTLQTITDREGNFLLRNVPDDAVLEISFVGYVAIRMKPTADMGTIILQALASELAEVEVVSTGYQSIPKERSTGSFDFIDTKTYNRAVGTDILSRLKGIGNGLLFDSNTGNPLGISVRGRSTLFASTQPLIVIDNFPYEGDLSSINPNDVEDVSILKDAAAASIWGTRAGNGVIVITTKRGMKSTKPTLHFNSNFTLHERPDLHYRERLSSSEFIEIERQLFSQGEFDWTTIDGFSAISPVVQTLYDQQRGLISETEAQARIQDIGEGDVLADLEEYFYRNGTNQQHSISINGGGNDQTYYLSAGIDQNLESRKNNSYQRVTLKAVNSFSLLMDRLNVSTDVNFISSNTQSDLGYNLPVYPYEKLADHSGNPLSVSQIWGLREEYTDTVGVGYLLDWKYRPLDELNNKSNQTGIRLNNYLINVSASYRIIDPLTVSVYYQFNRQNTSSSTLSTQESFYTRNLINSFSQINYTTGAVIRPIPLGDILQSTENGYRTDYGRLQLNFTKSMGRHHVDAIAGYEIKDERSAYNNNGYYYGYHPETETYQNPMDYITWFPQYYGYGQQTIPNTYGRWINTYRTVSYYSNLGYTFSDRYLLNASVRKDESNLFGVASNQRGVPLWSVGAGWNINKEAFYHLRWLPSLRLRATYGFNGNVDRNASAYLTSERFLLNVWQNPYDRIISAPNPALRWERVENINFGLDFGGMINNRLSGSVEYYIKNGKDLMGYSPIAPQTGIADFYGNVADTRTRGWDIRISSKNIENRHFKWILDFVFNISNDQVIAYFAEAGTNTNVVAPSGILPIQGHPINGLVSFLYAGLDNQGNPVGYLNGGESVDYNTILNSLDRTALAFHGSKTPVWFGSLRNTLSYKRLECSFNLVFKGGYYFRRSSFSSMLATFGNWSDVITDYADRWQIPGDENRTNVPAFLYPLDFNRENFYPYVEYLTERGDHIRLQDLQLNYQVLSKRRGISNLSLYFYSNNLGLLWKRTDKGRDPEFLHSYRTPRSFALGVKANF